MMAQSEVWMSHLPEPWEWPSWSRDGTRELRGEFELGADSPQWDGPGGRLWYVADALEWHGADALEGKGTT